MEDPQIVYNRVRHRISGLEFQLQQLEQEHAFGSVAALHGYGAGVGSGGLPGAAAGGAGVGTASVADRRAALSEGVNALTGEVAALDRSVQVAFASGPATKRELWRR
jgi:hypothetical protein